MGNIGIRITTDDNNKATDVEGFGLLNETDWKIIFYLGQKPRSVGELTRILKIAPINTWKHLNKLKEHSIIKIPEVTKGKKKTIELTKNQGETCYRASKIIYNIRKSNKK